MLGVSLLLACNSILVVCYFAVRALEADRRAGLAPCGVCWECGCLVCDTYSAIFARSAQRIIKDTRPKANTTLLKNTIENEKQIGYAGIAL